MCIEYKILNKVMIKISILIQGLMIFLPILGCKFILLDWPLIGLSPIHGERILHLEKGFKNWYGNYKFFVLLFGLTNSTFIFIDMRNKVFT